MKYDPKIHHRRSIRLRGYNYSRAGRYFVTICAHNNACLFGRIVEGEVRLNRCGEIVQEEWFRSARMPEEIELDAFVVMPKHIHGIVRIMAANGVEPGGPNAGRGGRRPPPEATRRVADEDPEGTRRVPLRRPRSLASFVAGFKSSTTKRIREIALAPHGQVWQRNYYEHIIRNVGELDKIREYITTNALRWMADGENPSAETEVDEAAWL